MDTTIKNDPRFRKNPAGWGIMQHCDYGCFSDLQYSAIPLLERLIDYEGSGKAFERCREKGYEDYFRCSQSKMIEMLGGYGLGVAALRRMIKELEDKGYIATHSQHVRSGGTNLYVKLNAEKILGQIAPIEAAKEEYRHPTMEGMLKNGPRCTPQKITAKLGDQIF